MVLISFLDNEISRQIKKSEINGENEIDKKYKYSDRDLFSFGKIITNDESFEFKNEVNDNDWILKFRIYTIQYLVELATKNFKTNASRIDSGGYNKELIEDDVYFVAKTLQAFTKRYILSQGVIQKAELTGHSVIKGLLDILIEYVKHPDSAFRQKVKRIISQSALKTAIHEGSYSPNGYHHFTSDELFDYDISALSPYNKLRLIVDFISGMTDKFAVTLYQELIGIKI